MMRGQDGCVGVNSQEVCLPDDELVHFIINRVKDMRSAMATFVYSRQESIEFGGNIGFFMELLKDHFDMFPMLKPKPKLPSPSLAM